MDQIYIKIKYHVESGGLRDGPPPPLFWLFDYPFQAHALEAKGIFFAPAANWSEYYLLAYATHYQLIYASKTF